MKSKVNIKIFLAAFVLLISANAFASLTVHPNSIRDTARVGTIKTTILHVTNQGPSNPLGYTVSENTNWLSVTPASGQIAIGETAKVEITFEATTLSVGEYTSTISVIDPHHGPISVSVTLVVEAIIGVENGVVGKIPSIYSLKQNYPNPFNPSTSIKYLIPSSGLVSLKVYTLLGEEAVTLVNGVQSAGVHEIQWRADALPSGVYIYRLKTEEFSAIRRMSFIK